jgi:hypothetical protein
MAYTNTNPAGGVRGTRKIISNKTWPSDNSPIAEAAQVKLEGHAPHVGVACHLVLIIDSATTWGQWPLGETWQWEFAGISSAGEVHWRRLRIGTGDSIIIRAEERETVPTSAPVRVARPGPKKCPGGVS